MRNWMSTFAVTVAEFVMPAFRCAVDADTWTSDRGLFRISFESSIDPVNINRIHEWIVHLQTAEGADVDNATLSVTGGMPEPIV